MIGMPIIDVIELIGKLSPLEGRCAIISLSSKMFAPSNIQEGTKIKWFEVRNNILLM